LKGWGRHKGLGRLESATAGGAGLRTENRTLFDRPRRLAR